VITTVSSLTVGIVACLLAFLTAILCRIDIAFNTRGAILLAISYLIGLETAIAMGRRCCRHDFELGNAIMVYSVTFFASVYAPITAIWTNTSLYRWAKTLTFKPKPEITARYVTSAVEHTACSHYVGAALLLIGGWFIARCLSKTARHPNPLGAPQILDILFAMATFSGAVAVTFWLYMIGDRHTPSAAQWLAYACGAFLFSLLFRSIRLQWRALRVAQSTVFAPITPRRISYVTIIALWLGFPVCTLIGLLFYNHSELWIVGLMGLGCLLPWMCYCFLMRGRNEMHCQREQLGALAMRCGFWSGLATTLILGRLLFVDMADKLLRTAPPDAATPFALGATALLPIYPLFAVPSIMVGVGGFLLAAILPPSTSFLQRITACAQGGAVLSVVNYVLMIQWALSLALLTVALIPIGKPLPPEVTPYFIPGNWYGLGLFNLEILVAIAAGGAVFWAIKASIVCGLIWLKNCIFSKPSIINPVISQSPAKNPPPAPSV
jgi:hypothetical protein